jgi:hypothetical protein
LPNDSAVLDGEIVCLDRRGRPRFNDLLFHRGDPCFFCFDLLFVNGQDMRLAQLSDRKHELRKLLARLPSNSRLMYADHIEALGTRLFERVCALDLEGTLPSRSSRRTHPTEKSVRRTKSAILGIHKWSAERSCSNVSGPKSLSQDGIAAHWLVSVQR